MSTAEMQYILSREMRLYKSEFLFQGQFWSRQNIHRLGVDYNKHLYIISLVHLCMRKTQVAQPKYNFDYTILGLVII